MIDDVVSVSKLLLDAIDKSSDQFKQDRKAKADLFRKISNMLDDLATSLKNGTEPHAECAEMSTYIDAIIPVISPVVNDSQKAKVESTLEEMSNIERLYYETKYSSDKNLKINEIYKAKGYFKGMASLLEAGDVRKAGSQQDATKQPSLIQKFKSYFR